MLYHTNKALQKVVNISSSMERRLYVLGLSLYCDSCGLHFLLILICVPFVIVNLVLCCINYHNQDSQTLKWSFLFVPPSAPSKKVCIERFRITWYDISSCIILFPPMQGSMLLLRDNLKNNRLAEGINRVMSVMWFVISP